MWANAGILMPDRSWHAEWMRPQTFIPEVLGSNPSPVVVPLNKALIAQFLGKDRKTFVPWLLANKQLAFLVAMSNQFKYNYTHFLHVWTEYCKPQKSLDSINWIIKVKNKHFIPTYVRSFKSHWTFFFFSKVIYKKTQTLYTVHKLWRKKDWAGHLSSPGGLFPGTYDRLSPQLICRQHKYWMKQLFNMNITCINSLNMNFTWNKNRI